MQATRLCLLGAALALAVTCASALLTPGETFPTLKPGVVITPNITTYTVSSQFVKARTWAAHAMRLKPGSGGWSEAAAKHHHVPKKNRT